jgi:hypothetical protein
VLLWIKDFRMVGFLVARGIKFNDLRIDLKGDVEFSFEQDSQTLATITEYPNSPEFRYDSSCRLVHDLVKSKLRSR